MRTRLRYAWDQVRSSYWFLPGMMALGAVILSLAMLELDARVEVRGLGTLGWLVYTGGAEGARGVLETIAGSMIATAGVVFSITIVALTLASSQFGPRVLSSFMRDRGNQVVLGTFVSAFLYSLLVLRTIRSEDGDASAVVPHLSITIALLLAILGLAVLIYFIHHVSVSIQAPNLIANIAGDLHENVESLFPERVGEGAAAAHGSWPGVPESFHREAEPVFAPSNGYIEMIDASSLLELATRCGLIIEVSHRPGHFATRGSPLARVLPAAVDDEVREAIEAAFVIGRRRTDIQDVEFPIDQLVEVAVRALSPGINDPFTALTCIDHLGAALCHLAERAFPSPYRLDERGELRLVIARPLTYRGIVDAAFHQIRQNASHQVTVYLRLLETIGRVAACVEGADQIDPLVRHAEMIERAARENIPEPRDREDVTQAFRRTMESCTRRPGGLKIREAR